MVCLFGYGQIGLLCDLLGFGVIGELMGGICYVFGYLDCLLVCIGIFIGDFIVVLYGVIGVMMVLCYCDVSGGCWNGKFGVDCVVGQGQMVDVVLYEVVFNMMELMVFEFDFVGVVWECIGGVLFGIVFFNIYIIGEGMNIVIVGNGDVIFKCLMSVIGCDDMVNDLGLVCNDGCVLCIEEIDVVIQQWCSMQIIDLVLVMLQVVDVLVGKIYFVKDMMNDV